MSTSGPENNLKTGEIRAPPGFLRAIAKNVPDTNVSCSWIQASVRIRRHRLESAYRIPATPLSPCTTGTSPPLFHDFRNFALPMRGCNLGLKCALAHSE